MCLPLQTVFQIIINCYYWKKIIKIDLQIFVLLFYVQSFSGNLIFSNIISNFKRINEEKNISYLRYSPFYNSWKWYSLIFNFSCNLISLICLTVSQGAENKKFIKKNILGPPLIIFYRYSLDGNKNIIENHPNKQDAWDFLTLF